MRRLVGAASRLGRRLWPRPGPAILMYHRVAEERFDPWGLAVHPSRFAEQMEWLANNRAPLSLTEFAHRHKEGRLSTEAVAITFDDGYACSAEIAAPLLNRLGIPATIFLPTALIRRGREFWWDDLERIILGSSQEQLLWHGETVRLGARDSSDRDWSVDKPPRTERQQAFHFFWSRFRAMRYAECESSLEQLRAQAEIPIEPRPSHRPMSVAEARSLRLTMFEFGSHGLTHPDLPTLSDAEKVDEISESIDDCLQLIGRVPRTFAYPYGRRDPRDEQLAAEAGYDCACTAESGLVSRSASNFALPRLAVGNWSAATFRQRLLGGA